MLDIKNEYTKKHLLDGNFGLEKESLRVLENGKFSHTLHPFPEDTHIVKDFCENQTEVNTSVHKSVRGAIEELAFHNRRIYERLQKLPQKEYLWPFSNPPYIENEGDIPVAVFEGVQVAKTSYRNYLSDKYGRYKMTFSGIHVNFSFPETLLRANWGEEKDQDSYQKYKDHLYLGLAKGMAAYGWILVAVTAASPLMDSSFVEKGIYGRDIFSGMASVRCSEMGYWNEFAPVFSYESVEAYVDSMQQYVDHGVLKAPSELYYPIRLKPRGDNRLDTLRKHGVDHIELRMFDLNPLTETGVEEKDIRFAQLLLVWLAAAPDAMAYGGSDDGSASDFTQKDQIQAVQNFKNAARYDLKTVKIWMSDHENDSVVEAAIRVIDRMKAFYRKLELPVQEILDFEQEKFVNAENRYAWKIREQFGNGYVKKALALAKERQKR